MRYRIHYIDVQNALQNYIWILEDTETGTVANSRW
ncbi:Zn-dependent hydrolase, including glyoxylase [Acinetobacter baumannii]|nr:Zn-dependent hydrolase, including glyoxylase [Acinetobacter baumannii]